MITKSLFWICSCDCSVESTELTELSAFTSFSFSEHIKHPNAWIQYLHLWSLRFLFLYKSFTTLCFIYFQLTHYTGISGNGSFLHILSLMFLMFTSKIILIPSITVYTVLYLSFTLNPLPKRNWSSGTLKHPFQEVGVELQLSAHTDYLEAANTLHSSLLFRVYFRSRMTKVHDWNHTITLHMTQPYTKYCHGWSQTCEWVNIYFLHSGPHCCGQSENPFYSPARNNFKSMK